MQKEGLISRTDGHAAPGGLSKVVSATSRLAKLLGPRAVEMAAALGLPLRALRRLRKVSTEPLRTPKPLGELLEFLHRDFLMRVASACGQLRTETIAHLQDLTLQILCIG